MRLVRARDGYSSIAWLAEGIDLAVTQVGRVVDGLCGAMNSEDRTGKSEERTAERSREKLGVSGLSVQWLDIEARWSSSVDIGWQVCEPYCSTVSRGLARLGLGPGAFTTWRSAVRCRQQIYRRLPFFARSCLGRGIKLRRTRPGSSQAAVV